MTTLRAVGLSALLLAATSGQAWAPFFDEHGNPYNGPIYFGPPCYESAGNIWCPHDRTITHRSGERFRLYTTGLCESYRLDLIIPCPFPPQIKEGCTTSGV